MPDSDAHPREIPAAQVDLHIAQAIVTTVATVLFQANGPGGQIQIVIGHEDLPGRHLVEPGDAGDRKTALVHEGVGLEQP